MALEPGVLTVTLRFGHNLKDGDFLSKSDPYVKAFVGSQTMRTKTHKGGGKNPVWNETFRFNVVNENSINFEVYDEDMFKDDLLGVANADLAEVRKTLSANQSLPVVSKKSNKQHGTISVGLEFAPNVRRDMPPPAAAAAAAASAPPPAPLPMPSKAPQQPYPPQPYAPPPAAGVPAGGSYSGPPPPGYPGGPPAAAAASASYSHPPPPAHGYPGQPPAGYPSAHSYSGPPPGYGAPPPGYPGAPPPGYPGAPPPGYPGAAPPPYGYPPQPGYGYPPPTGPSYSHGSAQRPPTTVYVQAQHGRPHGGGGMGAGAGMAMGALGGLAAGLFIADMADGDLFDAGF